MDISLKELLLAGIGTMAVSYEKAESIVDGLIKRGEIAVNDGKVLNEELKRKIDKRKPESIPFVTAHIKDILNGMNLATKQDIEDLKKKIDEIEKQ
jgi:polyhydroxyalkanoate synthesis regulator phasin